MAQQNADIVMSAGQYFLKHEFKAHPENHHVAATPSKSIDAVTVPPNTLDSSLVSNFSPASVTAFDAPVILSLKKAPVEIK